uniref:Uncharacterized protein n=1 Tax=Arundo donax TaxID=35708 RepID=A0A0A9AJU1_ARUDO
MLHKTHFSVKVMAILIRDIF